MRLIAARCTPAKFESETGLKAQRGFVHNNGVCAGIYEGQMLDDIAFILSRAGITFRNTPVKSYEDGLAKLQRI